MLRIIGFLSLFLFNQALRNEDSSQFMDYLDMLNDQMALLDNNDQKSKYNRYNYDDLFQDNEPDYGKLDELLETAYLDAVYKSLKKRAEAPVPSPKCTERSSIVYPDNSDAKVSIRFPAISPRKPDQYMCTSSELPFNGDVSYVVNFTPHASMNRAHHMLVFGCEGEPPPKSKTYWNCMMGGVCSNGGRQHTIWAWARNAPGLKLPKDVGFKLGGKIKYIVMQIHYKVAFTPDETDCSGVTLDVTTKPQKFLAGIFLMGAGNIILPPHSKNVSADAACVDPSDFTVFAFRTHAHSRANVITAYRYRPSDMAGQKFKMIGKGNPKWPESFYPRVGGTITVKPGDDLYARCIYSNPTDHYIYAGSTHNDEMCNFYMMFYTTDSAVVAKPNDCWDIQRKFKQQLLSVTLPKEMDTLAPYPGYAGKDSIAAIKSGRVIKPAVPAEHIHGSMDMDNDEDQSEDSNHEPLQHPHDEDERQQDEEESNIKDEDEDSPQLSDEDSSHHSRGHGYKDDPPIEDIKVVPDWLKASEYIGQVGGVAIDDRGMVHVFHRSHRVWGYNSFNDDNIFQLQDSPINNDTIYKLDYKTGKMLNQWGAGQFFMPHGATVDPFNNLWLTDVAMHQVFKYPLDGALEPTFTLGERFVQGSDHSHFCKPTSTAVDKKGYLYVADGYCNGRVVKFSPEGNYVMEWGKMVTSRQMISGSMPPPGVFNIVHSVALTTNDNEIWIADRENGRIQCYDTNGKFLRIIADKKNIGSRIFAISFSDNKNGLVHGVNGPMGSEVVEGFTIDYQTHEVVNKWGAKQIKNPHAIACFRDGTQMFIGQLSDTPVLKYVNNEVIPPPGDTIVPYGAFMNDQQTAEKKSSTDHSSAKSEEASKFILAKPAESSNEKDVLVPAGDDSSNKIAESPDSAQNIDDKTDDSAIPPKANGRGAIIAVVSILLVLPTVIIIAAFACIKMRQRRLNEYHGLLSRSSSTSKYSDSTPTRRNKPSINLGKFFKKSPDKAGFSKVPTATDSSEGEEDSDVELFKKDPEAAQP